MARSRVTKIRYVCDLIGCGQEFYATNPRDAVIEGWITNARGDFCCPTHDMRSSHAEPPDYRKCQVCSAPILTRVDTKRCVDCTVIRRTIQAGGAMSGAQRRALRQRRRCYMNL